jgi:alanyl aminopeptidase
VPFMEGTSLLFAGQEYEETRHMALANLQAHFDEILAKRPQGADFDLAAYLPYVGDRFCDRESRQRLQQFFETRAPAFAGGPRILAQVLEGIDLCIARNEAQGPSIAAYLQNFRVPARH